MISVILVVMKMKYFRSVSTTHHKGIKNTRKASFWLKDIAIFAIWTPGKQNIKNAFFSIVFPLMRRLLSGHFNLELNLRNFILLYFNFAIWLKKSIFDGILVSGISDLNRKTIKVSRKFLGLKQFSCLESRPSIFERDVIKSKTYGCIWRWNYNPNLN